MWLLMLVAFLAGVVVGMCMREIGEALRRCGSRLLSWFWPSKSSSKVGVSKVVVPVKKSTPVESLTHSRIAHTALSGRISYVRLGERINRSVELAGQDVGLTCSWYSKESPYLIGLRFARPATIDGTKLKIQNVLVSTKGTLTVNQGVLGSQTVVRRE